jgi:hypothetical protein
LSSQHVAASKKKKWLLLNQWLQSQLTTSSNTFAGRPFRFAPQNPTASARDLSPLKFERDAPGIFAGISRALLTRSITHEAPSC